MPESKQKHQSPSGSKKTSRKGPHPLNSPRAAALGLVSALLRSRDLEVQLQVCIVITIRVTTAPSDIL